MKLVAILVTLFAFTGITAQASQAQDTHNLLASLLAKAGQVKALQNGARKIDNFPALLAELIGDLKSIAAQDGDYVVLKSVNSDCNREESSCSLYFRSEMFEKVKTGFKNEGMPAVVTRIDLAAKRKKKRRLIHQQFHRIRIQPA